MKTKKSRETTKAKKAANATKAMQTQSTVDDMDCSWNQMSQEEKDELNRREEEFQEREEAQKVQEEQQLKTGKYMLLRHSDSPDIRMSEIGQKTYNEYLAKGDTEDLAFWRVVRNLRYKGFDSASPMMGLIKKGYQKWVVVKRVTEYGCCEMDPHHSLQFVFEKEKCIDDLTMELLERQGSITKVEYVKVKSDAEDVELIDWNLDWEFY
jgi:hypothetical protein